MSFEDPVASLVPLAGCKKPRLSPDLGGTGGSARHDSCVLHPSACSALQEFVNPLDLDAVVDHPTCSSVGSVPIGHCGSHLLGHKRVCAVTPHGCRDPGTWVRPSQGQSEYINADGGCTILRDRNYRDDHHDYGTGGALTRYVGCNGRSLASLAFGAVTEDGSICVPVVSECLGLAGDDAFGGDTIDVTVDVAHPGCDCSKTRTGACFKVEDALNQDVNGPVLNRYFCAVDETVCDPDLGLTYQSVGQLMRFTDIDCRLCDARTVEDYLLSVSAAGGGSGAYGVSIGAAAVIGISAGLTLGLVALAAVCWYRRTGKGAGTLFPAGAPGESGTQVHAAEFS